ncbi:MAG: hypothetical protein KDA28_11120, partial [Phycisphaerales bacterium]|nr:hypothetical protein [Phycisphaerales bacterium]
MMFLMCLTSSLAPDIPTWMPMTLVPTFDPNRHSIRTAPSDRHADRVRPRMGPSRSLDAVRTIDARTSGIPIRTRKI